MALKTFRNAVVYGLTMCDPGSGSKEGVMDLPDLSEQSEVNEKVDKEYDPKEERMKCKKTFFGEDPITSAADC